MGIGHGCAGVDWGGLRPAHHTRGSYTPPLAVASSPKGASAAERPSPPVPGRTSKHSALALFC